MGDTSRPAVAVSARRRLKGNKRARTRVALLDAARALVQEVGYERTTLRAVAARAGMTVGAIYGNFKNREDLFMALSESPWSPLGPAVGSRRSLAEAMQAVAETTLAALPERRLAARGRLTGLAYALDDEARLERMREAILRSYDVDAEWIRTTASTHELPMPVDLLVRVVHALSEGLVLQRLLTPDLVPDEVFHSAFAALAGTPRTRSEDPA